MTEEEQLVSENFDEYKAMIQDYSIEELMDIEKHVDFFDYPERKDYVQQLIEQKRDALNSDEAANWKRSQAARTLRSFLISAFLGGMFICIGAGAIAIAVSPSLLTILVGSLLVLVGIILPILCVHFIGWSFTKEEWAGYVESRLYKTKFQRFIFIFLGGFLFSPVPILAQFLAAYMLRNNRMKIIEKVKRAAFTINLVTTLVYMGICIALVITSPVDSQSTYIILALAMLIWAISPFGILPLLFYFSRSVGRYSEGIPAKFKRWFFRLIVTATILLSLLAFVPLVALLVQMLMNGIFSADMFTPIMPIGKGIGIITANLFEFFTDSISLSMALGFVVPTLLFVGLLYGVRKTTVFDLFVKDIPKPTNVSAKSGGNSRVERIIHYLVEK